MGQRSVGRYEILRVIGRGGMATVYLATQTDLRRDVALKELTVAGESDPRAARRFLREARLVGGFSHPNIVTVHDYFEWAGKPYIAMEYLSRGSLRPHVGRMSLPQIGGVLGGMLAGLAHAAKHDVVHRDLKPENVMVTTEGAVKIADFGIAKATRVVQSDGPNLTATGTTLGTPNYIAPEQAMARDLTPVTDLYSLGVMAWEMFVGRVPFADTQEPVAVAMRQVNDEIPPVSSLNPEVDHEMSDWVDRLLVKDPLERTPSAVDAADELDEILLGLLGPRWRRDAPLPDQPGARAAVIATPSRVSTSPLRPAGAGTLSATLPPRALAAAAATPATHRLAESAPAHRPGAGTVALGLLAIAALIAFFSGVLSGPKDQPASQRAPAGSTSTPPADQQQLAAPTDGQQGQQAPPTTGQETAPVEGRQTAPPDMQQAPPAGQQQQPPTGEDESGVGDSRSDDPSDDEPEP